MKTLAAALAVALLLPLGLTAADTKTADAKGAACAHEKGAATPGHTCTTDAKSDVILTGKLLCEHCNLHRKDSCSPVFAAEGRDGEIPLCPETKDVEKIKALGQYGKATLEVKGLLCKSKDGQQELMITSFAKKA